MCHTKGKKWPYVKGGGEEGERRGRGGGEEGERRGRGGGGRGREGEGGGVAAVSIEDFMGDVNLGPVS
jgi:hypothetical protein